MHLDPDMQPQVLATYWSVTWDKCVAVTCSNDAGRDVYLKYALDGHIPTGHRLAFRKKYKSLKDSFQQDSAKNLPELCKTLHMISFILCMHVRELSEFMIINILTQSQTLMAIIQSVFIEQYSWWHCWVAVITAYSVILSKVVFILSIVIAPEVL